jgi:hypothetical protein
MNKTDIKRVIDKLEPDNVMEFRLFEKILQKQSKKFTLKPTISIVASFVMVICVGILGYSLINKNNPYVNSSYINNPNLESGIYIPKTELPNNTNSNIKMDMAELIVYQGRVYTRNGTKIDIESAKKLLGEKLGTTKIDINEWSKQDDYTVEFESTIGVKDVYSVKGYDKSFRIMTLSGKNEVVYGAQFYECLNGITVKTGADIFDKFKIENNIKTAIYENFESWYYSKQQYKEFTKKQLLNSFVSELKNTIPYKWESLSYLFESSNTNQKFLYISLNDGSQVQLRLFKDGYIFYDNIHVFLKMEGEAFGVLWNTLV